MQTVVRSYSKINLGLAIGPNRPDGFHGLTTLYQTLELHDLVTVSAVRSQATEISITSNDERVPLDSRNTCWKMVERALARMGLAAEVAIHIEKRLPVQGGMGAGSANAAAALIGLEKELGTALAGGERLKLAGEVGSDVPLFLLGGSVLGLGRGEQVVPLPDMSPVFCVIAVPEVGVSTPQAFRDWDARMERQALTESQELDRLSELSLAFAALYAEPGTSGIIRGSSPDPHNEVSKRGGFEQAQGGHEGDLAENTLLSLVRTGVENDFEQVVFPAYPSLREIKRQLVGSSGRESGEALYAALSGSGSALFGLYRSEADAAKAQQRVLDAGNDAGTKVLITKTLPRSQYWTRMFAE
ncbi:MAG: 4-(cytidine 5'-diphospho)-2-C-methyl-D-erythritol kinase [Edaphobacter sp.]|uniref:4-(cytidine 5'-diphospho)-2-C-methyl-D-erythritol kinase n=1 Tax=Edaphobacter sp. TaxID=1934404 RepID=UPI002396A6FF|nr:4-(cytidine 5'-diphospho)-2-C-methyl-D-erythritol kinase [Edaphobacter sp.]MDE1178490.1 4-(cytidine 5'-diphospho)-2-C-methyl-D-erythritol kinase [Edaphobacter sp.]